MLRAHIPTPPKPAPFTETQAHTADHAYNAAKVNDPYRQRAADRATEREVQLRAAAGMVS